MIKVAQCWDDGVATDIRLVEIFRKYGAKATFNLCPGIIGKTTEMPYWQAQPHYEWTHKGFRGGRVGYDRLQEVYGDFCVASHCMEHEVAGTLPLADFVKAAVDARKMLEDFFQKECPGFAWPCGAHPEDAEKALADAGFAYGRTVLNTDNVAAARKNPLALRSNCHFQDCNFWNAFAQAKQNHSEFFYFWGHSYEMLDCDGLWNQLEEKIRILSEDPEVQWINVADIVR